VFQVQGISHLLILRKTPTGRKHTRQTQNNTIGCIGLENTATRLLRAWREGPHEGDGYFGGQARRFSSLVNSGLTGLAAVCRWFKMDRNTLLPTIKVQVESRSSTIAYYTRLI